MKRLFGSAMIILGLAAMSAVAAEKKNPMDANGDGKISKQEFCDVRAKAMEKAGKTFNKAACEKQFAAKDTNGDGFLSGDELAPKPKVQKPAPAEAE